MLYGPAVRLPAEREDQRRHAGVCGRSVGVETMASMDKRKRTGIAAGPRGFRFYANTLMYAQFWSDGSLAVHAAAAVDDLTGHVC